MGNPILYKLSVAKNGMDALRIVKYINILRMIQGDSRNISGLSTTCSPSRSTIRDFVRECEDSSLVQRDGNDYTLTTAGNLVVREYDNLDDEQQAGLSYLADSSSALDLLRASGTQPADKADLAKKSGTSRASVHRHLDNFQTSDWTKGCNGCIELDSDGEQILKAHKVFQEKIGVIEEKMEFLKRYENDAVEVKIPFEALAESRQVVSTMADKQKVVREVNDIDVDGTGPFRALSHSFSAQLSDEAYSNLTLDMDSELIVDRSVYEMITNPRRWKYLFRGFQYPNLQLLVLPRNITVALALCGDEEAVIATHNENHPLDVGLFSENEAFVEWVWELYENYRAQANSPGHDLVKWATSI